ncbi:MAG: hypothetical protein PWQ82_248 [Thermosediminibacterales bacterium]|nr:hypothetical protein [Thermosediminibacterales bacterium]MDK2835270.1 hypothetical protein [Thermosediminibacterales bacterium]
MDYMDEFEKIGKKIREIRLRMGFTQEQLGERAGLHYSYIGQVERGDKAPSLKTLKKISKALNTSLDYLLESKETYDTRKKEEVLKEEVFFLLKNCDTRQLESLLNIMRLIISEFNYIKNQKSENKDT